MSDTDPSTIPFGLIELDAVGTILYYKPEKGNLTGTLSSAIIGRNFFTDIIAIAEARELRESIKKFRHSNDAAHNFFFTFVSPDGFIQVKVLLAHIREHSPPGSTGSLFIHIRPKAIDRVAV